MSWVSREMIVQTNIFIYILTCYTPIKSFPMFIAPPVRFSALPETERNKSIQSGHPLILNCELSDPSAQVQWYKDGSKLVSQTGFNILTDGLARKLTIHSAELFHSGQYCCKTKSDSITFKVDIKGDEFYSINWLLLRKAFNSNRTPSVWFVAAPSWARHLFPPLHCSM